MFEKLEEYYEENITSEVPSAYKTKDGVGLGLWCERIRGDYRKGKLSSEIIDRFESFDDWVWDPREADWEIGYMIMQQVALDTGRAYVTDREIIDGIEMGSWCGVQRRESRNHREKAQKNKNHKKTEAYKLRFVRDQRLEELPGWSWDPQNDDFEEKIEFILKWCKNNPGKIISTDLVLPQGVRPGKTTYGRWSGKQRINYNKNKQELALMFRGRQRKALLEKIPGWSWDPKLDAFIAKVQLLEAYKKANGNYNVPRKYKYLGEWVKELKRTLLGNLSNPQITINLDRLKYLKGYISEISDKPYSYFTKKFTSN